VKDAPTRRLTKAEVVRAWETMLSLARAELDETTDPQLYAVRLRDVEALERRLAEIRTDARPTP
jgi:hypothetical protein